MKLLENKKMLFVVLASAIGVLFMVLGGSTQEKNKEYSDEAYAQ